MSQHLTEREVRRIAEHVRIGLSDAELAQMTVDLNNVVDSLGIIGEYDLDGVEPTFHPIGRLANVMREDVEVVGFTRDVALSNAPEQQGDFFLIPPVLGEGGDR